MLTRLHRYAGLAGLASLPLFFAFSPASPGLAGERCAAECYGRVPEPVIHRTFKRRITTERGAYEIRREPARYGWVKRRVLVDGGDGWHDRPVYKYVKERILLKPYKNIAVYYPERAYYTREHVTIHPEGWGWGKFSDW